MQGFTKGHTTLREGCDMPAHPRVTQADTHHPRYGQYLGYRAACTEQLVRAASFKLWLNQTEDGEADAWD